MIHYPTLFGMADYPESLRIVELSTTRWLCVVSKDHPTVTDELTEEQFLALPHLVGRPYEHTAPIEELARNLSDHKLDIRSTAQSMLDLPYMLIGTSLIATVPESVAIRLAAVLPIKFFPPPHPVTDSREILLWHRRNESDPGHAWLRELFIEAAKQL
jgi:LysR family transcriptional regulator, mexEF-oprN operon transcriptional activator